jgi:hypothetical protein
MTNSKNLKLVSVGKAAEWLAVSTRTLENWRAEGCGPAFYRLGRAVRYSTDELERFAELGRVNH